MKTETYKHHGVVVHVVSAVKGQHRDHCLCYSCARFNAVDRVKNCLRSNKLYKMAVRFDMVMPVYECPVYFAGKPVTEVTAPVPQDLTTEETHQEPPSQPVETKKGDKPATSNPVAGKPPVRKLT